MRCGLERFGMFATRMVGAQPGWHETVRERSQQERDGQGGGGNGLFATRW